jgi:hypothetical protein
MLALIYLPLSLEIVFSNLREKILPRTSDVHLQFLYGVTILLLVCFQSYQVLFNSWVAEHYHSHKAASLEVLNTLPQDKTIFLYNTPEAVVFLPQHMQYYQYIDISKKLQVGQSEIAQLSLGVPTFVLMHTDVTSAIDLSRYKLVATTDRYSLWYKK